MSALAVQSDPPPADQSTFGTKDPILAATLGNFSFQARNSLPVLLVVSAQGVIDHVDKQTGRVEDCAHTEFRFEAEVQHPLFGRISAYDISAAHEIAKLAQKEQTKEISGSEMLNLTRMREKWSGRSIVHNSQNQNGAILWTVQMLYDQVTNFVVICTVTKELAKNPLLEFSKQVYKGVAYAIEPCESEPSLQRRSEKLFRR